MTGEERARPTAGRRYSQAVGLAFLLLVGFATLNTINTQDSGVLGLHDEDHDLPLAQFAVPDATGSLVGDANVAQDDCETPQNPCPAAKRRKPACLVRERGALPVCRFFNRPFVLSFWFTRGGDCERQQDVVDRVAARYRGRVNVLSIDIRDKRDDVRRLIRERRWRMPVGIDRDGAVSDLYRVGGCPTIAYAYPGGILMGTSVGRLDDAKLTARLDDLLAASARRARTSR
jgi:thiol-disulfide isomerase/thioredoxin